MRAAYLAMAGAAAAAVAILWAVAPVQPTLPTHQLAFSQHAPPAVEERLFLSKPQSDQAVASRMFDRPVRSLLSVGAPLSYGDYRWNEAGVTGGATWIRVDLRRQIISVFRGADEVGTSVIVYGGDNKRTPVGHLHILAKARNHRSSLYDAEMPYTLRLTGDGVSIHASSVRWGAATHGCIGIPEAFAAKLFDTAKVGDEVVVVS